MRRFVDDVHSRVRTTRIMRPAGFVERAVFVKYAELNYPCNYVFATLGSIS